MNENLQQPRSALVQKAKKRNQEKEYVDLTSSATSTEEEDICTIKPEDARHGILDDNNNMFKLNNAGYGYRLSYKDNSNTLCFVRKISGEKEEILVEEKNLTEKQLQTAFQIFKNAYGYFGKVLKIKY